ncbi:MAG: hypothetical protein PVI26_07695, partial [Chitinispirillia bacterium]
WDILLKHQSIGVTDAKFIHYGLVFLNKWKQDLPASCVDIEPTACESKGIKNYLLNNPLPHTIQ